MELSEDTLIRWTLEGAQRGPFLVALSKLYKEINKIGFNHFDLTRNERYAFNDFVEQIAVNEQGEN